MARLTKRINKFDKGLTPDLYNDGFYRMEHFDVLANRLRPYGKVVESDTEGDVPGIINFRKFVRGSRGATNDVIWGLCTEAGGTYAIAYWNIAGSSYKWYGFQSFNAAGVCADLLLFYNSKIYGLWKGTHMWEMTTLGALNGTFQARTYTNYADPIIHSKDGLAYIPTDNIINSFNGTTLSEALTLPAGFVITSIAEYYDYINIVGYDSKTLVATAYQWDRDSSLSTLTAKYELGVKTPYHCATLGGTFFVVSKNAGTANSIVGEKDILIIDYLDGGKMRNLQGFPMTSLEIQGKFLDEKKLYFNAVIQPLTETANHWAVFELSENGVLRGSVNMDIVDGAGNSSNPHTGLYKSGEGFWIGGGLNGVWHTTGLGTTVSFFETTAYKAKSLTESIDFKGAVIRFEKLPSAAIITVKTKADNETAWTTIGTFSIDNSIEGVVTGNVAGVTTAKERRFRVESINGGVVTDFQVDLETKPDKQYS